MARAAGVGGVAAPVRARALRTGGATAAGRAGAAAGGGWPVLRRPPHRPAVLLVHLEHRHRLDQAVGLLVQAAGGSGHLFNQCCILLGGLVQLGHRACQCG